jgi:GNAT superfamily N-acetyltransferase
VTAPTLRDLAEDAYAYLPAQPRTRTLERGDHVLRAGGSTLPESTHVLRVRSNDSRLASVVEEVREWLRENDRSGCLWWAGPSSTPAGLARRLEALGLKPYAPDPVFTGLILETEPPAVAGVDVRAVVTADDVEAFIDVQRRGWEMPDDVFEQVRANMRANWSARLAELDTWWLALVDGEPAGNAISQYVADAAYLGGSTVVPEARGRGVYRALVRRRWDDARAHGARALVIQAGAMSRPIVERLGFAHVCDIQLYVDTI